MMKTKMTDRRTRLIRGEALADTMRDAQTARDAAVRPAERKGTSAKPRRDSRPTRVYLPKHPGSCQP